MRRPALSIADILAWADAFQKHWRRWPTKDDGPVAGQIDLTWCGVDQALQKGHRGLRPGSSLAKLLLEHRGKRHRGLLPNYTLKQILIWADLHHQRTGVWPTAKDGAIAEAPGETWLAVQKALADGNRGLPGGSSLAQLLAKRRGVRNISDLPLFTVEQVLAWADAHKARTGEWPTRKSGPIVESPPETWRIVNEALVRGWRGLPPSGSLAQLLAKHRGVRNRKRLPRLSLRKILRWADAYHQRTGRWPTHLSGPISEAPGETWSAIHDALYRGLRGFRSGSSLYQLLRQSGRRDSRVQSRRHS
jgi:hypothetical protein